VRPGRYRPNGRAQFGRLLVFEDVTARPRAHRVPHRGRPVRGGQHEDSGAGGADRGHVLLGGGPVTQIQVEQDHVGAAPRPGEQGTHGRRGGDDADAAARHGDPAGDAVQDDRMVIHDRPAPPAPGGPPRHPPSPPTPSPPRHAAAPCTAPPSPANSRPRPAASSAAGGRSKVRYISASSPDPRRVSVTGCGGRTRSTRPAAARAAATTSSPGRRGRPITWHSATTPRSRAALSTGSSPAASPETDDARPASAPPTAPPSPPPPRPTPPPP